MLRLLRGSTAVAHRYSAAYSIVRAASSQSGTYILEDMVTTRKSRETAIKEVSLPQAITNLKRLCAVASPPEPVSAKHAAVLVPLFAASDGSIHVILTQRSSKMNSHAGEVCFPGGKRDPHDASDVHTALREAHEELGINPACVNVIATLPPVLSKHLLSVTPVIATVPSDLKFTPNPQEVAHVFTAPLDMFLSAGPGYSYRDLSWEGNPYRIHAWEYAYKDQGSFVIWGLTAGMLILVAERAFDTCPQFEVHPPGAPPYTALAVDKGRLVFRGVDRKERMNAGADGQLEEGRATGSGRGVPSSAAVQGATVMEEEAEAAVGCESTG